MNQPSESEIKEKKHFLYRYRNNQKNILRLNYKLETLESRITKMRSSNFSGMPRGGIPVSLDDLLSDKVILESRIKRLKTKNITIKQSILDEIDTLEDVRHAEVLELYFVDCMSFDDISEDLGYDKRHITRLYSEAIISLIHSTKIALG